LNLQDTVDYRVKEIIAKAPNWFETLKANPWFAQIKFEEIDWQGKAVDGAKLLSTFFDQKHN